MTQFGRALAELNIEILCANSSQDKGRVERANLTLQDRLVKELRAAEVSDMDAGNLFLPAFMEQFNERFSVPPAKTEDLHRRLSMSGSRFKDILFRREQRYVDAANALVRPQADHLGTKPTFREVCGSVRRALRLRRPTSRGSLERCLASLPSLQQGPADQSHGQS